jgi:Na+/proline symporter
MSHVFLYSTLYIYSFFTFLFLILIYLFIMHIIATEMARRVGQVSDTVRHGFAISPVLFLCFLAGLLLHDNGPIGMVV